MNELFPHIVGQSKAKEALAFHLSGYPRTHMIPHLLLVAAKGQGKTKIARAIADNLHEYDADGQVKTKASEASPGVLRPARKKLLEVNCATIKNVKQFVLGFLLKEVQDKDVTVFLDEASAIPLSVQMALLTILEPKPRTSFTIEDYTCEFDFRRQSFILATSEAQDLFDPLKDRFVRVSLQDYTLDDLAKIIKNGLGDVKVLDDVLLDVATVLRGNARAAHHMVGTIQTYLNGTGFFNRDGWEDIKRSLSIYPLGLNEIEIQILQYLSKSGTGMSLTGLSARTGMSRSSLQKDGEMYLQRQGLMEITTTGRMITGKGLDYIRNLPLD